ncbi:MAG: ATP-binding protein [Rariglobus sp.]
MPTREKNSMNATASAGRLIILGKSLIESAALDSRVHDLGYDVVAIVDDPEEACARASQSDLVLIDLHLGGEAGGVSVSHRLRREHNLPVVLVARRDDTGDAAHTARKSRYGCVHFPLQGRELQAVLQNAIVRHQVDIERRRLEQQQLVAQKAESLGVMSRHLAHDFNNILQGILGHVQLAALDLPNATPAQAYLEQAVRSGMRGAALCRQFLTYSTPSANCPPISELSAVVRDAQVLLRAVVKKGVRIDYELAADLPHLDITSADVQQILFNLALNASDACTNRSGLLRIVTGHRWLRPADFAGMIGTPKGAEGEYGFIELTDDGEGISAEVAVRMFEPFFTTRFKGNGLGLTAVLDLANLHGGAVEVISRERCGATFRVFLPVPRTQASG